MINAGIDLYTVGKVLGPADHKSTMRYSHLANATPFGRCGGRGRRTCVSISISLAIPRASLEVTFPLIFFGHADTCRQTIASMI